MINIYRFCLIIISISLLTTGFAPSAQAATARYKKNTVVDFEGANIEGKSRKPYSAYMSEKTLGATHDLAAWQPDFLGKLQLSRRQWEQTR